MESLVTTAGVITALLLAFVAAQQTSFDYGAFDRVNFREALYDWPNTDFVDFVIYTLNDEGVNLTLTLDSKTTIQIDEVLRDRRAYREGRIHTSSVGVRKLETVVEYIFPDFPTNKLNSWFVEHYQTFIDRVNRSNLYFQLLNAATALLVISMVASIVTYLSLVYSPANEDRSGRSLQVWSGWAFKIIILIYISDFISMIFFLTGVGNAIMIQDSFLYKTTHRFEIVMYFIAAPLVIASMIVSSIAAARATQSVTKSPALNEQGTNEEESM